MYRGNPPGLHVCTVLPPCDEVSQVSQISSAGELQGGFRVVLAHKCCIAAFHVAYLDLLVN